MLHKSSTLQSYPFLLSSYSLSCRLTVWPTSFFSLCFSTHTKGLQNNWISLRWVVSLQNIVRWKKQRGLWPTGMAKAVKVCWVIKGYALNTVPFLLVTCRQLPTVCVCVEDWLASTDAPRGCVAVWREVWAHWWAASQIHERPERRMLLSVFPFQLVASGEHFGISYYLISNISSFLSLNKSFAFRLMHHTHVSLFFMKTHFIE